MRPVGGEHQSAAAFVLAGGESRRMGRNKALVELAGVSLARRALKILRDAGFEPGIAGSRGELDHFSAVIEDIEPDRGPLGGICAALSACREDWAVFIPVDLPLLPAALISLLARWAAITGALITVPSVCGFAETFPAVVSRAALPGLKDALRHGCGGCYSAFGAATSELRQNITVIPVEYLVQTGQVTHPGGLLPAFWFLNVNSPADLARAEAIDSHAAGRVI